MLTDGLGGRDLKKLLPGAKCIKQWLYKGELGLVAMVTLGSPSDSLQLCQLGVYTLIFKLDGSPLLLPKFTDQPIMIR